MNNLINIIILLNILYFLFRIHKKREKENFTNYIKKKKPY